MNSAIYSLFVSLAVRMTVITLFIMLIKLIFKNKLSAASHCAIWGVLPVQTIFCLTDIKIPSKASIYNAMPEIGIKTALRAESTYDFRNLIAAIYIIGVMLLALWYVVAYIIHFIRVLKAEEITDDISLKQLAEVKVQLGVKKDIILRSGGYAHTVLNTIVLPIGYSKSEIRQILTHELYHYKHKDNLKLWIAVAVICLNWFNPIVWLAFMQLRLDIEMYCDDSVIKMNGSRKDYARVLVKTANNNIHFVPGTSGAANSTNEVSKRVKRIVIWKRKKPIWFIAAMFSTLCVACLCLTNAANKAVENVAPTVIETPKAVDSIPKMADAILPAPSQPTANPTLPPQSSTPKRSSATAVPSSAPIDVPENNVSEGQNIGERTSVSANGSKETYAREDGSTVILQYNEGELETGYIIEGD